MKKKLLLMSLAVICCGLFSFAEKPVNVIEKYMENYTDPYYYKNKINAEGDTVVEFSDPELILMYNPTVKVTTGGGIEKVENDFPRYHTIGAPWKTEGLIGEFGKENFADGGATCWHVDLEKGKKGRIRGTLTLTSGWGDFAEPIENMKVFQTTKTELPAAKFDLNLKWGQDKSGAPYTFLVVTKGTSIPDTADLVAGTDANVLGYVRLNAEEPPAAGTVSFELTEPTKVTIGLVASFPKAETEGQGYCSAMGDFELIQWITGTNYSELINKYNEVKRYKSERFPTGEIPGNYSKEAWDAFVVARDNAKQMIDNIAEGSPLEDPNYKEAGTQAEVDALLEALQTATDNLHASLILPVKFSTDAKNYYYKVSDMRGTPDFWIVEEDTAEDGVSTVVRLKVTQEFEQADNNIFKFVKVEGKKGFYIYSKSNETTPISRKEGNMIIVDENITATSWVFRSSERNGAQGRFIVQTEEGSQQMNGAWGGKTFVGIWNDAKDAGNAWKFERVYLDGEVDFAKLNDLMITAKTMKEENYPTGTGLAEFSKEKWDAFVAARTAAETVLAKESDGSATQAEVDAAATALETAIKELDASKTNPFLFSNDTEEHYYLIHDKHSKKLEDGTVKGLYNFWKVEEVDVDGTTLNRVRYSKAVSNEDDMYRFKFVKTDDGKHFNIFSKTNPTVAIAVSPDNESVLFVSDSDDALSFRIGATPVKDLKYFVIEYLAAETDDDGNPIYKQLNSFGNNDEGNVGVWKPASGDDAGNDWTFVEEYETGLKNLSAIELGVFVKNGRILSTDANAVLNVFSIAGQRVNANNQLTAGVYIVTVAGKQGAAKVIVK